MKIRILSDLHYEHWERHWRYDHSEPVYLKPLDEDVLVLAGDIHSGSTNVARVLRKFASLGWRHIVYVPGNHEYYGTSFSDFNSKIYDRVKDLPNVHVLLDGYTIIDGVAFVGSTLWTNFGNSVHCQLQAKRYIADFKLIKDFDVFTCEQEFYDSYDFIRGAVSGLRGLVDHTVVVTHFLPSHHCVHSRWKSDPSTSLLNHYFANDLDHYIETLEDVTWICGHTHDPFDIKLASTRIIANPLGYPNEGRPLSYEPTKQLII